EHPAEPALLRYLPGRTVDIPWQCGSHARQPAGPARARVADRHRGNLRGGPAPQPAARRPGAAGESVGSAAARPAGSVRRRTAGRRPAVLAPDQPLDPGPAVRAASPLTNRAHHTVKPQPETPWP